MSKGLEALEVIKHTTDLDRPNELNGYHNELYIIEKELKVLEIIKNKLPPLMRSALLDYCNKEEYKLLKEVLL